MILHHTVLWTRKPPNGVSINPGNPLSQGLIACWLFQNGGLTHFDATGRHNGDTVDSTPLWVPGGPDGGYVAFANKVITAIPLTPLWSVVDFSVSCFIRFGPSPGSGVQRIFSHQAAGGSPPYWGMAINNQRIAALSSVDSITYPTGAAYGPQLNDGLWHRLDVNKNYRDGQMTYWVDGKLVKTDTATSSAAMTVSGTGPVLGGWTASSERLVNHFVSDIKVWNRSRTPAEIQSHFVAPYQMFNKARMLRRLGALPVGSIVTLPCIESPSSVITPVARLSCDPARFTSTAIIRTPGAAAAANIGRIESPALPFQPSLLASGTVSRIDAPAALNTPALSLSGTLSRIDAPALTHNPSIAAAIRPPRIAAGTQTFAPSSGQVAGLSRINALALALPPTVTDFIYDHPIKITKGRSAFPWLQKSKSRWPK